MTEREIWEEFKDALSELEFSDDSCTTYDECDIWRLVQDYDEKMREVKGA